MFEVPFLSSIILGIPEISISLLLGLVIVRGNVFRYERWTSLLLKLIISVTVIAIIVHIARGIFSSLYAIIFLTFTMCVVTYKLVFGLNLRQSILAGSVTNIIGIQLEIFSTPICDFLLQKHFEVPDFTLASMYIMPILRIIQVLIIILLIKFNKNFSKNYVLNEDWSDLPVSYKFSIITVLALLVSGIVFNINYLNFYFLEVKQKFYASRLPSFMPILAIQTTAFFFLIISSIVRTIGYEENKKMLESEVIEDFLEGVSLVKSEQDLKKYIEILKKGRQLRN